MVHWYIVRGEEGPRGRAEPQVTLIAVLVSSQWCGRGLDSETVQLLCAAPGCVCRQLQLLHHKEEPHQEPGRGTPGPGVPQLRSTLVTIVPTVPTVNTVNSRDSSAKAKVCEDC